MGKVIGAECTQLMERGTCQLEELSEGRKAISCKWVFDWKKDENGNIIKYKAQLIAQGFSQKPGVGCMHTGTFAPVMHFETLRTMLALGTATCYYKQLECAANGHERHALE